MSTSLDEAKAEAAAAVANAFLEDFAADGVLEIAPETSDAAPAAAQPQPVSQPAPTQEAHTVIDEPASEAAPVAAPEPEFDFTLFEPQLTPDLEELLDDTPDFDAEARAEIDAERQLAIDRGEYVEPYDDTDTAAKLKALEKRNAFLEQRIVESNRGKWVQENLRAYPLLAQFGKDEVEAIDATSRRGFAREAAKLNERVTRIAKPMLDQLGARLQEQRDAATVEARQQVTAAWGEPATDVAGQGSAAAADEAVAAAMRTQDLGKVIRAQVETGKVKVF